MIASLYLAAYLLCGVVIVRCLLPRHSPLTRLWLGLSLGLLLMMWLPALLAFRMNFTAQAHYQALIPLLALTALALLLRDRRRARGWDRKESVLLGQMILVVLPLTLLSGYLQYTHCVRIAQDGSWWGGQATYGDLAMHMSFVTSLKNAAFPPEYALFPGQQLSYPFLMDSLSTSFYLLGWPIQLALTVPGTFMMALCYAGVMCLARELTAGKKTVILAALLFFLNGGLGFVYDLDLAGGMTSVWRAPEWTGEAWTEGYWESVPVVQTRLENILEGYYKTPTNQPTPHNLRWSNVIADLMLPQRTLLGGWCMVIPCFYLLFTAFPAKGTDCWRWRRRRPEAAEEPVAVDVLVDVQVDVQVEAQAEEAAPGEVQVDVPEEDAAPAEETAPAAEAIPAIPALPVLRVQREPMLRQILLLGLWAGALPLIHTHSFTALALCSLGLVIYDLFHTREERVIPRRERPRGLQNGLLAAFLILAAAMAALTGVHVLAPGALPRWTMTAGFAAAMAAGPAVFLLDVLLRRPNLRRRVGWYALYALIAGVCCVPQLFGFTFNQVFQEGMQEASNSFIEPWFNWVNTRDGSPETMIDGYGWFYLKNIGLPFLILIVALFEKDGRWRRIFMGALPIILAAECIRFQPNIYDNNKLMYLAWLLCAMIVADWCGRLWHKLKGLRARPVIAGMAAVAFFLSAGLTLWREAVSEYQLFSAPAVEAGEYIRDNTEEDAVILTGAEHHLNPAASIAGRRIVCGPDLWLYYHGLDTAERKADIARFYADPAGNQDVIDRYGVDYVMVSSYEMNDYRATEWYSGVDVAALDALYGRVFENREAIIWRVTTQETGEDADAAAAEILP